MYKTILLNYTITPLKFSIEVVNRTAAASTTQLAKSILLHAYSRTTASSKPRENTEKLQIAYLTSWHDNILGYKSRTIEAENP